MTNKEVVLNTLESIKRKNPNAPKEQHWMILLSVIERVAKEKNSPELMIAFFRFGLKVSGEMNIKHPGWEVLMKQGLGATIRLLQAKDQSIAAGMDKSFFKL